MKNPIELVNKRYPKIGELVYKKKKSWYRSIRNRHEDTKVQEGDEVALLPPFTVDLKRPQPSMTVNWYVCSGEDFRSMQN